jgi:phosphoglycerate dehydrogenase-like enzyme
MRVLLVARDPTPVLEPLAQRWPEIEWVVAPSPYLDTVDLTHFEVAYMWDYRSRQLRELWPRLPELRWVHVAAAGVDAFLFPEMLASDVIITNSRGAFDEPVTEFALALILATAKRLNLTMANQGARHWQHYETRLLAGRRALIVGFGAIGHRIGRSLRDLGMRVVGIRRSGEPHPDADEMFTLAALREQLGLADYVVLVLPQTDETRQLIGADELRLMRPSAVLVNVGRGSAVNELALAEALTAGTIAGAALDVFEREPLAEDHPLWTAPNVLITPHMASDADDWRQRIMDVFSDNLTRYLENQPLLNVIDKQRGY